MNTSPKRQLLRILPLLLLAGCASQSNQPPPPEVRARIATAKVEASAAPTRIFIMKPYSRGQAAVATGMEMLEGGEELGLLLLPIGVPVGAMFGTPKDEAEAGIAILTSACSGVDFQKTVRREVVEAIRTCPRQPVVAAGRSGNHSGASTVLELNVADVGLAGDRYKGSKLHVFMVVEARLRSLPDGAQLYRQIWRQTGAQRTFKEWTAQGGSLLRQELAVTSRKVAQRIVWLVILGVDSPDGDWHSSASSRAGGASSRKHGNRSTAWYGQLRKHGRP